MLITIGCWVLLCFFPLVMGCLLFVSSGASVIFIRPVDRFLSRWYLGMTALACLLLAASLKGPINGLAIAIVFAALPAACLLAPSIRRECLSCLPSRPELAAFAVIAVAAAANASGLVTHYDTGLYHYPMIRWLHEHGSVPGLGLFHGRFAFSSSWLAFSAVFDAGILQGRGVTVLNGLVMTMLLFQLALAIGRYLAGEADRGDMLWIGACPLFILFSISQRFHISPSPNFAVAAGILHTCWLLETGNSPAGRGAALLASAGTLAIKLNAVPLLVAAFFSRLFTRPRRGLPLVAIAAILLACPIVLANLRTSGCPFYPSSLLCMDGKASIPPESARAEQFVILHWARYGGHYPAGASFWSVDWISRWLSHPVNAVAAVLALSGAAGVALLRAAGISFWIGLGGAVFVLITAPDLRFGIGYVVLLPGALIAAFLDRWRRPPLFIRPPLIVLALLLASGLLLDAGLFHWLQWSRQPDYGALPALGRLMLPVPLPVAPAVTRRTNDIEYRVPVSGDSCWAAAPPCTPYDPGPAVRLCSPEKSLAGGFCRAVP